MKTVRERGLAHRRTREGSPRCIAAIGGVGVAAIVLRILGSVVARGCWLAVAGTGSRGRSNSSYCLAWVGRRSVTAAAIAVWVRGRAGTLLLLAVAVRVTTMISVPTTVTAIVPMGVAAMAPVGSRRAALEILILLSYIGQEILA